jgi:hypothetical protein
MPRCCAGKICCVQIPAVNQRRSVDFYETVSRGTIRSRDEGEVAVDDTVGEVSGTWMTGRPRRRSLASLLYIMVESVARTLEARRFQIPPACSSSDAMGLRRRSHLSGSQLSSVGPLLRCHPRSRDG